LQPLLGERRKDLPKLWARGGTGQVLLLRLVTVWAEIADHDGRYGEAERVLEPYRDLVTELRGTSGDPAARLEFTVRSDPDWRLLRQKLYYVWQLSVVDYRKARFHDSDLLMQLAMDLALRLQPRAEGLLTQLYYGAAKLALHESDFLRATMLYRRSLTNAAELLSAERRYAESDAGAAAPKPALMDARTGSTVGEETLAAQYTLGKVLALGLGQCLREQGRLEEAQMVVVAGRLLLDLSHDRDLSHHARLLLASIQRGAAGEKDLELLRSARAHVDACAEYFKHHHGDVWYRARYERGLVLMQEGELDAATAEMRTLEQRARDRGRDRWSANAAIGLSRIARRAGSYADALAMAREARKIAGSDALRKIERRARIAVALALYDAAEIDTPRAGEFLAEADRELDHALATLDEHDIRNRVMLFLLKARVLNAKGDGRSALRAYDEYRKIGYLVEVGRVRALAEDVERELLPVMRSLRVPVDGDDPKYELHANVLATELHVFEKVHMLPGLSETEKAKMMGVSRTKYYELRDAHRKRSRRSRGKV
jgi:hypothetical protein